VEAEQPHQVKLQFVIFLFNHLLLYLEIANLFSIQGPERQEPGRVVYRAVRLPPQLQSTLQLILQTLQTLQRRMDRMEEVQQWHTDVVMSRSVHPGDPPLPPFPRRTHDHEAGPSGTHDDGMDDLEIQTPPETGFDFDMPLDDLGGHSQQGGHGGQGGEGA